MTSSPTSLLHDVDLVDMPNLRANLAVKHPTEGNFIELLEANASFFAAPHGYGKDVPRPRFQALSGWFVWQVPIDPRQSRLIAREIKALGRQQLRDELVLGIAFRFQASGLPGIPRGKTTAPKGGEVLPPTVGPHSDVEVIAQAMGGIVVEVFALLVGIEQVPDEPTGLLDAPPLTAGDRRRGQANLPLGEAGVESGFNLG